MPLQKSGELAQNISGDYQLTNQAAEATASGQTGEFLTAFNAGMAEAVSKYQELVWALWLFMLVNIVSSRIGKEIRKRGDDGSIEVAGLDVQASWFDERIEGSAFVAAFAVASYLLVLLYFPAFKVTG